MKLNSKIILIAAALMTVSAAPAAFAAAHAAPLQMINPHDGVQSLQTALEADFTTLGIVGVRVADLTMQQLSAIEAVIVNQGDYAIKKGMIEAIVEE